jgi:hypothetical protein
MLNFGPGAVPVFFAMLGWFVGRLQRFIRSLGPWDARRLLVPLLVTSCFSLLVGDSDNIVFFLIKQGLVPFSVVVAASVRQRGTLA